MFKRYCVALCLMLGLIGCQSTVTEPELELPEITEAQLKDLLFTADYGLLINKSLDGDTDSLAELMRLGKHTNGGGAYGFGVMLQAIALEIGDSEFAKATTKLSKDDKQLTHQLLLAGFDYGDERYTVDDFEVLLPETYKLTNIE